jgi:hypothetical protein
MISTARGPSTTSWASNQAFRSLRDSQGDQKHRSGHASSVTTRISTCCPAKSTSKVRATFPQSNTMAIRSGPPRRAVVLVDHRERTQELPSSAMHLVDPNDRVGQQCFNGRFGVAHFRASRWGSRIRPRLCWSCFRLPSSAHLGAAVCPIARRGELLRCVGSQATPTHLAGDPRR